MGVAFKWGVGYSILYHNALTRNPSILIQVENSVCVSSQDEIEKQ